MAAGAGGPDGGTGSARDWGDILGGAGAGRDATTGWRNRGTDNGDGWSPPVLRCTVAGGAALGASAETS